MLAVATVLAYPLDGQCVARRLMYHFYLNNHYDPQRKPFVIEDLPFQLTAQDRDDLLHMVDENGIVRSVSSVSAMSADHVVSDWGSDWFWVPSFLRGGTVNGTAAYSSFIERDNPVGSAKMLSVRDRVVQRMREHNVLDHTIYGVNKESPWAAFSVTSRPFAHGDFRWHYDAESEHEYRALFVVRGGDDCGRPAVHYRDENGTVRDVQVKTGHGYLIRGSQTFHAVYGGCPPSTNSSLANVRHMVGFQLSQRQGRSPMPVCAIMLNASAQLNALLSGAFAVEVDNSVFAAAVVILLATTMHRSSRALCRAK